VNSCVGYITKETWKWDDPSEKDNGTVSCSYNYVDNVGGESLKTTPAFNCCAVRCVPNNNCPGPACTCPNLPNKLTYC
jgi:hypothetical protein